MGLTGWVRASVSRPGRPHAAALVMEPFLSIITLHVFARARWFDRAVFFVFGFGEDVRWAPLSRCIVQVCVDQGRICAQLILKQVIRLDSRLRNTLGSDSTFR